MVAVPIEHGSLEAEVFGTGTPSVLVIQTALHADELAPLSRALAAHTPGAVIHCHRRGYAGSSPAVPGATMAELADDVRGLIGALGLAPVHLVGVSFSSAIALTLAAVSPRDVHTLTVVETPPIQGPTVSQFRTDAAGFVSLFEAQGAAAALAEFLSMLAGPDWREWCEADMPGSVAAMERDAVTFFTSDMPALLHWEPERSDLSRIRCPVLCVGGQSTSPWFREARQVLQRWLPQSDHAVVPGAGHVVATTHTEALAELVSDFIRQHPATPTPAGADRTRTVPPSRPG
ncbi:alpha/beta fold hydrolase [Pseudactinotalea sp. Z1739]|uniref:alpha/beta fold hydrolase n=1 Tax=Pseudactinotalea sp. Z1739 TaxID=3413028 RepID=UPI003C79C62D